ncbi:MAG: TIGR04076 family protein [Candidatus Odinarchaeota archaeon]
MKSEVRVEVIEVRGKCPVYKTGDEFSLEQSEIRGKICLHALASLMTFLIPLRDGLSPEKYGLGKEHAYLQCPDPGPPYTRGGTVVFCLKKT